MQLLRSLPIATPEFVSLSLLLKPDASDTSSTSMGEPLVLASSTASVSSANSVNALKELHFHLTTAMKASSASSKGSQQDRLAVDLLKQDDSQLQDYQVFRPLATNGIGLHYRLVGGDSNTLSRLSTVILASNKSSTTAGGIASPSAVFGVIICVGFSGLSFAHSSSSLQYSIGQRMSDCVGLLTRIGANDPAAAKALLSTLLLTQDEERKSNSMIEAPNLTAVPEIDEAKGGAMGVMSPIGIKMPKRMSMKAGMNGDMPVEVGSVLALGESSADVARSMTERLTVLSVAETDTFLTMYETSGQERKANLDLTGGGKSRFGRKKGPKTRDPDFEGFDYKGPAKEVKERKAATAFVSEPRPAANLQLRQPPGAKIGAGSMPALMAPRKDATQRRLSNDAPSLASRNGGRGKNMMDDDSELQSPTGLSQQKMNGLGASAQQKRRGGSRHQFIEDASQSVADSVQSQARVQVNIALNEDLSCSYKLSQLSSCNVEGVVQVQVKSNARSNSPFFLLMRDPSKQVESLQENKKYADDVSASINGDDGGGVFRKFTISVPKADNYFPVLRYKCIPDLRPVPIRVQTRVKTDGGYCRVALQISSNPNNEANLTDLTIIMGVPDEVIGETLATQPAGGVWNESKRSVIWCVSELGDGEKFQLQARFEMAGDIAFASASGEKPKFPVLVRCQCLFAQLSDIEVEVRDIPDAFPADVGMKLARRFRLSHRERS